MRASADFSRRGTGAAESVRALATAAGAGRDSAGVIVFTAWAIWRM
jgi:hypothetical protein